MATGNQWAAWRSLPRKTVAINVSVPMKYYNKAGEEPIWVYEAPARSQAASLPVFSYFVMTNRNKLLFSDRCFWRHVAFSVLWLAQGGVVRNPTLTDLDTSRNPLIPPHQAPQQSPSRSHWSSENWATPSGMTMQRRGHAMVSFLVASRIELKSLGRIWMFAASPGWTWKNTICAWGEELPGEHGDRAGGAPCWDGVWVTLSSARFPGLEEGKKTQTHTKVMVSLTW